MKRIYIAGPMRGYPEHNFPAFNEATARFRAAGYEVLSPVEIGAQYNNNPRVPGGMYIRRDVEAIATCDAIALLPGWEASTGARCEVALAITIGLEFYDATTMELRPPPERVLVCGGYERPAAAVDSLDALLMEAREWQAATFPQRTPSSIAEHLRREALELCAKPTDPEEQADVFLLLAGISEGGNLASAVRAKLEKNKRRRWGAADTHGVVEHVGAT